MSKIEIKNIEVQERQAEALEYIAIQIEELNHNIKDLVSSLGKTDNEKSNPSRNNQNHKQKSNENAV